MMSHIHSRVVPGEGDQKILKYWNKTPGLFLVSLLEITTKVIDCQVQNVFILKVFQMIIGTLDCFCTLNSNICKFTRNFYITFAGQLKQKSKIDIRLGLSRLFCSNEWHGWFKCLLSFRWGTFFWLELREGIVGHFFGAWATPCSDVAHFMHLQTLNIPFQVALNGCWRPAQVQLPSSDWYEKLNFWHP